VFISINFKSNLYELLEKNKNTDIINNIWILNDIVIPFNNKEQNISYDKYLQPKNFLRHYEYQMQNIIFSLSSIVNEVPTVSSHSKNFSLNPSCILESNQIQFCSKNNIITMFACNKQGRTSNSLVLIPNESTLEADFDSNALNQDFSFTEIDTYSFLDSFTQWIHR
jgi:hypothetical protein